MELMSQIPTQISGLVGKKYRPKKVVKFSEIDYINVDSSSSTEELDEEEDNESTDQDVSTSKALKSSTIKSEESTRGATESTKKAEPTTKKTPVESTKRIPESIKRKAESTNHRDEESTRRRVDLADAITDTSGLGPKSCDAGTQTEISLFSDDYDIHRRNGQENFASFHKPMYSIPKRKGGQLPPLKLGLTLPKGKKRRVFYPGEDRVD